LIFFSFCLTLVILNHENQSMQPLITPARDEFLQSANSRGVVPVWTEILADLETPVSAYIKLGGCGDRFLLESVEQGQRFARYSFVGANPDVVLIAKDGKITIREKGKVEEFESKVDPLRDLECLMSRYKTDLSPAGLPPFFGGAVGFLSYECVRHFERTVPTAKKDDLAVPDAYFVITDTLLAFDHLTRRLKIIANAHVHGGDPGAAYDTAVAKIQALLAKLAAPMPAVTHQSAQGGAELSPAANMTRDEYIAMTAKMKEYIFAGDIFQVVPSQRFEVPYTGEPITLYRALRSINPSPYMFCIEFGEQTLVGSSPEVHVRCQNRKVEVRPIAGTRPRRETKEEDDRMERELLADEKERAEHVMLVDLGRNDVGRACDFHTVRVPEFMVVERYSHVMHIVSQVEGRLREDSNAYDLMRATFPAGTVTGAPKVRAMQIIAEVEPTRRGTYAGAVGYFSFNGNLDSCIAIRTMLLKDGKAYVQAGGGLVADSTPEGEYQESVNKAKAAMRALSLALHNTNP